MSRDTAYHDAFKLRMQCKNMVALRLGGGQCQQVIDWIDVLQILAANQRFRRTHRETGGRPCARDCEFQRQNGSSRCGHLPRRGVQNIDLARRRIQCLFQARDPQHGPTISLPSCSQLDRCLSSPQAMQLTVGNLATRSWSRAGEAHPSHTYRQQSSYPGRFVDSHSPQTTTTATCVYG
jgi:hypothetical protein